MNITLNTEDVVKAVEKYVKELTGMVGIVVDIDEQSAQEPVVITIELQEVE